MINKRKRTYKRKRTKLVSSESASSSVPDVEAPIAKKKVPPAKFTEKRKAPELISSDDSSHGSFLEKQLGKHKCPSEAIDTKAVHVEPSPHLDYM